MVCSQKQTIKFYSWFLCFYFKIMAKRRDSQMSQDQSKQSVYEVDKILDKKTKSAKDFYLVSWKGYSENQATWEPVNNMSNCSALILQYELNKLPNKDKKELSTAMEQEDSFYMKENISLPPDVYDFNLELVGQRQDKYANRLKHIKQAIYQSPPNDAKLSQIICPQFDSKSGELSHYRVRVNGNPRIYRISRQKMMENNSEQLAKYYQKLIIWQQ